MFKSRIAFVKATSWYGGRAEHSYGRLYLEDTEEYNEGIELTHKLTRKQAMYLNKKNSCGIGDLAWTYKEGDDNHQFDSDEEVYVTAKKYLEDNNLLENYDFLLEGDFGSAPCYTVWSRDEEKMKTLNEIYKRWENSNSGSEQGELIDEWQVKAREYNILKERDEDDID